MYSVLTSMPHQCKHISCENNPQSKLVLESEQHQQFLQQLNKNSDNLLGMLMQVLTLRSALQLM